jgi:uncharacterized protein YoxC
MELQDIFYITAIIFMVLAIGILVGLVLVLFYIKKTVDSIHATVEEQMAKIRRLTSDPAEIARGSGAIIGKAVTGAIAKLRKNK